MVNIEFGLIVRPTTGSSQVNTLLEYNWNAIQAVSASFTTLWVEDHLQWGEDPTLECITTLGYLAGAFPTFKVGTIVLSQSYRNPALIAKMAANLQFLSGGRFILGIGTGWKADEYHAYGYPFPNPKIRVEQLEEVIHINQSMWSSSHATFIGRHYSIKDAYCEPRPTVAIPLLIGGGGEQRTLKLVARYADWWNYNSCTVEEYARKVTILKKYCSVIGRDLADIRLTYLATVSVAEDPSQVVRHPEKHYIAGNATEVIRELRQFCDVGVTHFMVKFPDLANLRNFVQDVVPHFVVKA
jgi:alkanesulfonate monooxygenase SsuD/methylene tetrahydromethanopterin reductase-like flavin-dependent oxidoreductase (luciferase family)